MLRKTAIVLAAIAAIGATTTGAMAHGKKFHGHFHHKHYGHGFKHYKPFYGGCHKVFVGYRKVWTYYGWVKKPIYRCAYKYGYGY